jgi:hypothetical protein
MDIVKHHITCAVENGVFLACFPQKKSKAHEITILYVCICPFNISSKNSRFLLNAVGRPCQ